MSTDYDNTLRTMEPGVLAPADGNAGSGAAARCVPPVTRYSEDAANHSGPVEPAASPGPNNERLEELKPKLVSALRELVRQYREEGVVARRHEIRRIRQARLFWQGLQYAWWNPSDMNWHLPFQSRSNDDRALEDMPRYQFVTNF